MVNKMSPTIKNQAHQLVEHDLWFCEQASIALKEADSEQATWLEPQDIRKRMENRASGLRARLND